MIGNCSGVVASLAGALGRRSHQWRCCILLVLPKYNRIEYFVVVRVYAKMRAWRFILPPGGEGRGWVICGSDLANRVSDGLVNLKV